MNWHMASRLSGLSGLYTDSFQMKDHALSKGRKKQKSKNTLTIFKNLLLKNHWANFMSMGEGNLRFYKYRAFNS